MSKISVTTIAGLTSGGDANKVIIESGDTLQVDSNATVGGTLGVTGVSTLSGNATVGGTLGVTGIVTANAGVKVDNITIDGTEIDLSSGNLTIDVAGQLVINSDSGQVVLQDDTVNWGNLQNSSGDFIIGSLGTDKDIKFQGLDGSSTIDALTLDMSDAGSATFNHDVNLPDNGKLQLGASQDLQIYHNSTSGNSFIADEGTGGIILSSGSFTFQNQARDETHATMTVNGAVDLYHNNTKRFETQSDGCKTHGVHRIIADAANAYALFVKNDGNNSNRYGIQIMTGEDSGSSTNYLMGFVDGDGNGVGSITFAGSNTSFNTSSDYRLKNNIADVTDATAKVKELKPKKFSWKKDTNNTLIHGFLAHEVAEVIPEAVVGEKDAVDDDDKPIYQGIDHSKLVPLLTKALQEAIAKIETLEAKVAVLESE